MCQYQTLFHDDHTGYVIKCQDCGHIQVGFGNLMVTFERPDFEQFRHWLHKIGQGVQPSQSPTARCIGIPTPCEGVRWLLSRRELNDLETMLDTADSELRTMELLRLFDGE